LNFSLFCRNRPSAEPSIHIRSVVRAVKKGYTYSNLLKFSMSLLPYTESRLLLEKYDLPIVATRVVENQQELEEALVELGFPLVMKIDSEEVVHKTEQGGVRVGIGDRQEAEEVFQELSELHPRVLLQQQIEGEEIIIGGKRDEVFGPVVMAGLGGVLVEVYKDVAFRLAPPEKEQARQMLEELRGKKLLQGYRGRRPVNQDALAELIVKTGELLHQETRIQELDFNPVIAAEELLICDVKIMVSQENLNE